MVVDENRKYSTQAALCEGRRCRVEAEIMSRRTLAAILMPKGGGKGEVIKPNYT